MEGEVIMAHQIEFGNGTKMLKNGGVLNIQDRAKINHYRICTPIIDVKNLPTRKKN